MCKRLFFLISIVLVLGLVGNASAGLVGRWTFDDGTADDSGPGGHHGTLTPGDETTSIDIVYDADRDSNVLVLNNPEEHTINAVVDCGGGEWTDITSQITIAMWAKIDTAHESSYLLTKGTAYQIHQMEGMLTSLVVWMEGLTPENLGDRVTMIEGPWHHVAVTFDSIADKRVLYVNGAPVKSDSPSGEITTNVNKLLIGGRLDDPAEDHRGWDGWLDDVQLYDHVLSEGEIRWMNGMYSAYGPNPQDEEEEVATTLPSLTWKPGAKVADVNGHKLYFGTDLALVEANNVNVYKGAFDSCSYSGEPMGSLTLGTTYYWRVIEVNGIDEWLGDVWEFSTPPLEATEPDPLDEAKYVGISRTKVGWKAGVTATNHAVYYGTDETLVTNGDASVYKGTVNVPDPCEWTISPALIANKTYYWRIDVNAPDMYQGDVWSFETMAPTGDPNLIAWWKLDETSKDGEHVFDASGNEHYGTLEIPDEAHPVEIVYDPERDSNVASFPLWPATWINCGGGGTGTWADFAGGYSMTITAFFKVDGPFPGVKYPFVASKEDLWRISRWSDTRNLRFGLGDGDPPLGGTFVSTEIADDGEWHHIAGVYDGTTQYIYWDGALDVSRPWSEPLKYVAPGGLSPTDTHDVIIGGNQGWDAGRVWDGWISDVRLYNRALSRREIARMGVTDPNKAWWPYPAHKAVDVSDRPLTLTWEPGDNVALTGGHRVYFGTDKALVDANDASVDKGLLDANNWPAGELVFDITYYWRVDESNGATTWRGIDWTFDMANFKLFDDFESYDPDPITTTWERDEETGALINLGKLATDDEVNGGRQSMKYEYDSDSPQAFVYYSEAYRDFGLSPQDWSYATGDVKSLRLYFYGETDNYPDDMYVVLEDSNTNDSMKLYDRDLSDLKAGEWKEWDIDLSGFTTVHLGYIKKVYIGFGIRGNEMGVATRLKGTVYFDDFRVYPPHCVPDRLKPDGDITENCIVDYEDVDQMVGDWLDYDYTITPSNPTDANLLGYWNFDDGTANDSSGKNHHGTLVTGGDGTSVSIVDDANIGSKVLHVINAADTNNAVVDCGGDANDVGDPCWANLTEQLSVAAWFTLEGIHTSNQYLLTKGNTWQITSRGTNDGIRTYYEPLDPDILNSTRPVMDTGDGDDWHHIAITYDSTAPSRKLYIDGREAGSDEPTGTLNVHWDSFVIGGRLNASYIQRGWIGKIDEVRYYDDVLTHAEVVYLITGTTDPVYFDVYSPANITDADDPVNSRFVNFKDYDVLADNWLTELLWPSGW